MGRKFSSAATQQDRLTGFSDDKFAAPPPAPGRMEYDATLA
jgi:hypothetical protein